MKQKYYIYGSRPIIEVFYDRYERYYAFQWDSGEFKEDITYMEKIFSDRSGDSREVTKGEFDSYVASLRKKRGLE